MPDSSCSAKTTWADIISRSLLRSYIRSLVFLQLTLLAAMTLGQLSTAVRGLLTRRDGSDNAIGPQVGDESHPAGQLGLRQCSEPIDSSHAIEWVKAPSEDSIHPRCNAD